MAMRVGFRDGACFFRDRVGGGIGLELGFATRAAEQDLGALVHQSVRTVCFRRHPANGVPFGFLIR